MTGFWARHGRKGIYTLGWLLLIAGLGTLNAAAQTPAETTATDYDDPLKLFAKLMPVFQSPRCVNCHGGTDPQTGRNHGGGQVDVIMDGGGNMEPKSNTECVTCHTAATATAETGDWHLPPLPQSFVGKDTLQMCRHMRFFKSLALPSMRPEFINHLENDKLILLGFEGKFGMAEDDVVAEPPPMTHREFLDAAQRWVNDGEAGCKDEWSGEIMQISTMAQSEKFAPAAGGREVGADTTVTITVIKNKATAEVHWDMHDFIDVPTRECPTYLHHTWSAVDYKLPIQLTMAVKPQPTVAPSQLPPGFTLPPGFELPPGFTLPPEMTSVPGFNLPPGVALPPGMEPPSAVGAPFFTFGTTDQTEVIGKHHSDVRSLPGCQQVRQDEVHRYHVDGARVDVTVDPNTPYRIAGEKFTTIPGGRSVIRWDLTRDMD